MGRRLIRQGKESSIIVHRPSLFVTSSYPKPTRNPTEVSKKQNFGSGLSPDHLVKQGVGAQPWEELVAGDCTVRQVSNLKPDACEFCTPGFKGTLLRSACAFGVSEAGRRVRESKEHGI